MKHGLGQMKAITEVRSVTRSALSDINKGAFCSVEQVALTANALPILRRKR